MQKLLFPNCPWGKKIFLYILVYSISREKKEYKKYLILNSVSKIIFNRNSYKNIYYSILAKFLKYHSGPEKFKKVQAKKLVKLNKFKKFVREIAFLAVLNFFPVQKLMFAHFWNRKKWNLAQKFFFVKLIYFISQVFCRA